MLKQLAVAAGLFFLSTTAGQAAAPQPPQVVPSSLAGTVFDTGILGQGCEVREGFGVFERQGTGKVAYVSIPYIFFAPQDTLLGLATLQFDNTGTSGTFTVNSRDPTFKSQ